MQINHNNDNKFDFDYFVINHLYPYHLHNLSLTSFWSFTSLPHNNGCFGSFAISLLFFASQNPLIPENPSKQVWFSLSSLRLAPSSSSSEALAPLSPLAHFQAPRLRALLLGPGNRRRRSRSETGGRSPSSGG